MHGLPQFRDVPEHVKWWTDARFGVSFHWGLYALAARGEWVRSAERLTIEQYQKYFDRFNPDRFDPRQWARLARQAGMRYSILTTKHHDGFCMFDSALTAYKVTNTPARRDVVREYVEAFRAEGIKVGLYYSLVDWHHPDYPAFGDRQHPMRDNPQYKDRPHRWENYVNYLHRQVRELLTNYGRIDLMVFDFSYDSFTCEKWGAEQLAKMVRELQPGIVVNDRMGNAQRGSIKDAVEAPWVGDFDTCEQNMPHSPATDGHGRIPPWDLWITHSNSWSFNASDKAWKTPADIIRTLANCVSKSGNLTLNFAPDARGQLAPESIALMEQIGRWMSLNSSSIHGCGMAPFERPDWGRYTTDGKRLYAHITEQPIGHLTLRGLRGRVANPRLLANSSDAFLTDFWNIPVQQFGAADDIFLNLNQPVSYTYPMPDPINTVIAMDLVSPAEEGAR